MWSSPVTSRFPVAGQGPRACSGAGSDSRLFSFFVSVVVSPILYQLSDDGPVSVVDGPVDHQITQFDQITLYLDPTAVVDHLQRKTGDPIGLGNDRPTIHHVHVDVADFTHCISPLQ